MWRYAWNWQMEGRVATETKWGLIYTVKRKNKRIWELHRQQSENRKMDICGRDWVSSLVPSGCRHDPENLPSLPAHPDRLGDIYFSEHFRRSSQVPLVTFLPASPHTFLHCLMWIQESHSDFLITSFLYLDSHLSSLFISLCSPLLLLVTSFWPVSLPPALPSPVHSLHCCSPCLSIVRYASLLVQTFLRCLTAPWI